MLDLWLLGDVANAPDRSLSGLLKLAIMCAHLLVGLACFGSALTKRLRLGVATLAICALLRWTGDIPLLTRETLRISLDFSLFSNGLVLLKMFGQPLICAGAIAAAWCSRYLAAATLTLAAMTVVDVAEMAVFAIAVFSFGI